MTRLPPDERRSVPSGVARGEHTRKPREDLERADWPLPTGTKWRSRRDHRIPWLLEMIENFAGLYIAYDARKLYVAYRLLSAQIHPSPQGKWGSSKIGVSGPTRRAAVRRDAVAAPRDSRRPGRTDLIGSGRLSLHWTSCGRR